jgi:hypothetical protein
MSALTVRFKKNADGTSALTCVRPDGSTTWHSPKGAQGRFFALHDLTHFAVESTLRIAKGFYGIVASGWDISEFGAPERRGQLPPEAGWVEVIVGFLDMERASGETFDAAECNEKVRLYYEANGGAPVRDLTDADLNAIRDARRDLFARWAAVAPGETLELEFGTQTRGAKTGAEALNVSASRRR